jgi:hypothetical protein
MGFISVLVPAWGGIEENQILNVWYWGFYFLHGWNILERELLIPGLVVGVIILIGTVLLLLSVLSAKKNDDPKKLFSLIGGVLLVLAPTLFLITSAAIFNTIWIEYLASFGLILPFIGGFLAILSWYSLKR